MTASNVGTAPRAHITQVDRAIHSNMPREASFKGGLWAHPFVLICCVEASLREGLRDRLKIKNECHELSVELFLFH